MSADIVQFPTGQPKAPGADERLDDMRALIDATAPMAEEMGLRRFVEAMVTVAKVAAAEDADTPADYAELFRNAAGDLVSRDA